eukprot:GHVL01024826.1.p1 GENE.GHVL01024826.1~~GHVL01024826.1.p1  ORF type:complete len:458 (+),score=79.50 GHVL01024826.1:78-1451(+)
MGRTNYFLIIFLYVSFFLQFLNSEVVSNRKSDSCAFRNKSYSCEHEVHDPEHIMLLRNPKFMNNNEMAMESFSQIANLVTSKDVNWLDAHHDSFKKSFDTTIALADVEDNQYLAKIYVGNPPVEQEVVLDTGSSNTWIISDLCHSAPCNREAKLAQLYSPKGSTSEKTDPAGTFLEISFGTGELDGPMAIDDFRIGPFHIKDQSFSMIQREVGPIFNQIKFRGIMGLAFPSMSSNGVTPIFDSLMTQNIIQNPEFSFYLSSLPSQNSAMYLGGVDERLYIPPIQSVHVIDDYYWQVNLKEMRIGDEKVCCDEPTGLILDTGTTYLTAPSDKIPKILRLLGNGQNFVHCDKLDNLPTITYVLDGVTVDLTPKQYMVHSLKSQNCHPGFMAIDVPRDHGPAYLLGDVFFRHYYITFKRSKDDQHPSTVGFAKSVPPSDEAQEALLQISKSLSFQSIKLH